MTDTRAIAEAKRVQSVLLPIREEGRWGYITPDKAILIQPEYDSTGACLEGQPYAVQGDEILILSHGGNINARVENCWSMQSFQSGLLAIERDGEIGFCNAQGEIVIAPQYLRASPFTANGSSVCCETQSGERWHRIQTSGEKFNDLEYSLIRPFLCDETATGAKLPSLDRYLVVDGSGHPLSMTQFADVRSFSDGLVPVRFATGSQKMGWIDDNLEVVVPGQFDDLGDFFSDGAIPACHAGLWGLAERDGNWAIEPRFRFIGNGGNGIWPAAVNEVSSGDLGKTVESVMTLIDRNGQELTEQRFAHVSMYDRTIAQFFLPRPATCTVRDPIPFGYIGCNGETIWSEEH